MSRLNPNTIFRISCHSSGSRDSSVGIAIRYGLDGPGIESRWGAKFSAPIEIGSEAHPASYRVGTGSFPGIKRPGRDVYHPPLSNDEVKKKSKAIILPPSGSSWPDLGSTVPLPLSLVINYLRHVLRGV